MDFFTVSNFAFASLQAGNTEKVEVVSEHVPFSGVLASSGYDINIFQGQVQHPPKSTSSSTGKYLPSATNSRRRSDGQACASLHSTARRRSDSETFNTSLAAGKCPTKVRNKCKHTTSCDSLAKFDVTTETPNKLRNCLSCEDVADLIPPECNEFNNGMDQSVRRKDITKILGVQEFSVARQPDSPSPKSPRSPRSPTSPSRSKSPPTVGSRSSTFPTRRNRHAKSISIGSTNARKQQKRLIAHLPAVVAEEVQSHANGRFPGKVRFSDLVQQEDKERHDKRDAAYNVFFEYFPSLQKEVFSALLSELDDDFGAVCTYLLVRGWQISPTKTELLPL